MTATTNKYRFTHLGSVSSGTLRPGDLIPAFIDMLESLKDGISLGRTADTFEQTEGARAIVSKIDTFLAAIETRQHDQGDDYWTDGDASEDVNELSDWLNSFAPTGIYFGSHPGDGADFGFWVSENLTEDFDGFQSSGDGEDIPDGYIGEWLYVNDHGNVTLYVRDNDGEDHEVWSCV